MTCVRTREPAFRVTNPFAVRGFARRALHESELCEATDLSSTIFTMSCHDYEIPYNLPADDQNFADDEVQNPHYGLFRTDRVFYQRIPGASIQEMAVCVCASKMIFMQLLSAHLLPWTH